jgi:hypothetical protein
MPETEKVRERRELTKDELELVAKYKKIRDAVKNRIKYWAILQREARGHILDYSTSKGSGEFRPWLVSQAQSNHAKRRRSIYLLLDFYQRLRGKEGCVKMYKLEKKELKKYAGQFDLLIEQFCPGGFWNKWQSFRASE